MKGLGPLTKLFLGLVALSLAGSLLSRLAHLDPGPIAPVASAATLLVGIAAMFRPYWPGTVLPPLLVLLFGAAIEIVGLATGYPFGSYQYTHRWQPTVTVAGYAVPLLLPFAWLLVAGGSYLVASGAKSKWGAILIGALLATGIDVLMEPVMTNTLHYWRWIDRGPLPGSAPVLNPIGWFLSSLVAGTILSTGSLKGTRIDPLVVLLGYLCLVLGLGVIG